MTKDVPEGALAIARVKQENKEGYASKLKARLKAFVDRGQLGREQLADAVDQVGAHGVAAVGNKVHHEHAGLRRAARLEHPHLQLAGAAAAPQKARLSLVAAGEQRRLGGQDRRAGRRGVGHLDELDLGDHQRRIGLGDEAAAFADHAGGVARRGDDRGLLDAHRDQVVAPVDLEVEAEAQRQGVGADDVLDDVIGLCDRQAAAVEELQVRGEQAGAAQELVLAVVQAQLVEAGQARARGRALEAAAAAAEALGEGGARRGVQGGLIFAVHLG